MVPIVGDSGESHLHLSTLFHCHIICHLHLRLRKIVPLGFIPKICVVARFLFDGSFKKYRTKNPNPKASQDTVICKHLKRRNYRWCNHNHHKHKGFDTLIRSVSTVTTARANASSVFQLFSFLVVCSGMT